MSDPSRKLSMSNLKPQHQGANLTAPGSPTASIQTNPSATNPLNQSDFFQNRVHNNSSFINLPGSASHHNYVPNAHAARLSQTPSVASLPGMQSKHRSPSMVMHSPAGHAINTAAPAPTSVPPELVPTGVSSIDASEPRLFPGIMSKSRKGSMVTSRSGLDLTDDNIHEHMTQSMPTIALGRPRGDDDEAIVEDEIGETD